MPDVGEFFSETFSMLEPSEMADLSYVISPKSLVPLVTLYRPRSWAVSLRGVFVSTLDRFRVVAKGEYDLKEALTFFHDGEDALFARWHTPRGLIRPDFDLGKGLGTAMYLGASLASAQEQEVWREEVEPADPESPYAGIYSHHGDRTREATQVWRRLLDHGLAHNQHSEEQAHGYASRASFDVLPAASVLESGLTLFPTGLHAQAVPGWVPPPPHVLGQLEWSGTPYALASTLILLNVEQSGDPERYLAQTVAVLRQAGDSGLARAVMAREGELEGARQLAVANPPLDFERAERAWESAYGRDSDWA